jgi:hypothetical protein
MLRLVALVRTDVSEERIASIITVTRIGEQETTLATTDAHSEELVYTSSQMAVRLSVSSIDRALLSRNISISVSETHFC